MFHSHFSIKKTLIDSKIQIKDCSIVGDTIILNEISNDCTFINNQQNSEPSSYDSRDNNINGSHFDSHNNGHDNNSSQRSKSIPLKAVTKIEAGDDHFTLQLSTGKSLSFYNDNIKILVDWIFAIRTKLNGLESSSKSLTINDFNIIAEIGRGRYSTIKLVEKKDDHKQYAMKIVEKSFLVNHGSIQHALAERNIMRRVSNHPFIVTLDYAFQSPTTFYFVMEYVKGGDLFRHMKNSPRLRFEEIQLYVAEIALAIHHLHSFGIVYRDLKPENILLTEDGHIKLIDFNLSKELNGEESTSTFCGTVEYLAPEIVNKEKYGKAVDWWSLGVMIFEMVFNRTPFACQNPNRTLAKIATGRVMIPDCRNYELVRLIDGLLRKDPKKRFCFKDIVTHPFFHPLDFNDVYKKKYTPLNKPTLISLSNSVDINLCDLCDEDTQELSASSISDHSIDEMMTTSLSCDLIYVPDFTLDNSICSLPKSESTYI
ncbi:AGC family protein kinase [Tritrichomonas foetus]|uniref:AGC family protein kinase n=1 Tax=Tritrichomonas foetus TaxID=1144522 RepID=A0A1J4JF50_9EUKA|nr:AGC family protein kinase [Tritrichomonas foetus]|eukprot:OHS96085.1 AGC family protein kinase [Tritrichomonas foetus]